MPLSDLPPLWASPAALAEVVAVSLELADRARLELPPAEIAAHPKETEK